MKLTDPKYTFRLLILIFFLIIAIVVIALVGNSCITVQKNVNSPDSGIHQNNRDKHEQWPNVEIDPELNIGTGNKKQKTDTLEIE